MNKPTGSQNQNHPDREWRSLSSRSTARSSRVRGYLMRTRASYSNGSGADRIVGAIRPGVRPGDAAYAAMT